VWLYSDPAQPSQGLQESDRKESPLVFPRDPREYVVDNVATGYGQCGEGLAYHLQGHGWACAWAFKVIEQDPARPVPQAIYSPLNERPVPHLEEGILAVVKPWPDMIKSAWLYDGDAEAGITSKGRQSAPLNLVDSTREFKVNAVTDKAEPCSDNLAYHLKDVDAWACAWGFRVVESKDEDFPLTLQSPYTRKWGKTVATATQAATAKASEATPPPVSAKAAPAPAKPKVVAVDADHASWDDLPAVEQKGAIVVVAAAEPEIVTDASGLAKAAGADDTMRREKQEREAQQRQLDEIRERVLSKSREAESSPVPPSAPPATKQPVRVAQNDAAPRSNAEVGKGIRVTKPSAPIGIEVKPTPAPAPPAGKPDKFAKIRELVETAEPQDVYPDKRSFAALSRHYTNRIHCDGEIQRIQLPVNDFGEEYVDVEKYENDLFLRVLSNAPDGRMLDITIVCDNRIFLINGGVDNALLSQTVHLVVPEDTAADVNIPSSTLKKHAAAIEEARNLPLEDKLFRVFKRVYQEDYLDWWEVSKINSRNGGLSVLKRIVLNMDGLKLTDVLVHDLDLARNMNMQTMQQVVNGDDIVAYGDVSYGDVVRLMIVHKKPGIAN